MKKITEIAQIGDPILRKTTNKVKVEDIKSRKIKNLIKNLIFHMKKANGAGLAANQIYSNSRICVLEMLNNPRYKNMPDIPLKVLINPKINIIDSKSSFSSYEGCLSVPNLRGKVNRYSKINVEYFDENANYIKEDIQGLQSIVYQHEIDHLDGILFIDKVKENKSLVTYSNFLKYHANDYQIELENYIKSFN